ncbi:GNAT family N-acetyltransferase [Micromonospora sp. WMMA1923]|uniref:GNAT family N-acetyltransferase n=1 Tax=Micromonospora sp. WMMA1923 TaxID=3404125 RepID=UPI003B966204
MTTTDRPDVLVRVARADDAPAVVALRARVYPFLVRGVATTRRTIVDPPPGEQLAALVAEVDGEVVGWVSAYRNGRTARGDTGEVSTLHVHPERRGRGIGGALLGRALGHLTALGVRTVRARVLPDSLPFARRHGFDPGREQRYSALDLRPAPPSPVAPTGVRLLRLADVDPGQVYRAEAATVADVPDDVPADTLTYEFWRYDVWDDPGLDHDSSTVAWVDGGVAAYSLVQVDGDRMWSDYTATVPRYRGRGLARLVKQAALHRAAHAGVRIAYTANDEANAPMLAVNTRVGYRAVGSQWSCLRRLD